MSVTFNIDFNPISKALSNDVKVFLLQIWNMN